MWRALAGCVSIRLSTPARVLYKKCGSICACSARRRASASKRAASALYSRWRMAASASRARRSAALFTKNMKMAVATANGASGFRKPGLRA